MKKLLLCACFGLLAAGCGTVVDTASIQCRADGNGPRVFGGVRTNITQMGVADNKNWVSEPILVLDTPLSAIFDIVMLPASVSKAWGK